MKLIPALFALSAVGLATAAICSHPAAQWRLEVLRKKVLGDFDSISWTEILTRLPMVDAEENGGRWVLGSVTVLRAEREGPCPVLFDTPLGPFRGRLADEWELEHVVNKYLGLNRDARAGLVPIVEPGDTVVELGPWLGAFTRHALLRGAARVIAVEPAPENIACMKLSFADEIADGRVVLVEAAAWSEPGRVRMTKKSVNNPRNNSKGYNVTPDGELQVRAVRLDDLLEEMKIGHVDLINMDIEGSERHALAGAARTIERSMPEIVVCVHHLPDDLRVILGLMKDIAPDYEVATDNYHVRLTRPRAPRPALGQDE